MSVSLWQAVVLGVVQGLTEFLPVSSTVHLALAQHFLPGFSQPGILFDVMLHVGTLLGVVVFFRGRILEVLSGLSSPDDVERGSSRRLLVLLAVATAMTGLLALPLKRVAVEGMMNFRRMGFALLGTALLLFFAQRVGRRRGAEGRSLKEIGLFQAALVGACQAVSAVLHGLSRSGNTISVGLFSGMSRQAAAEFSFLLSIPTILAAAVVENWHAFKHDPASLGAAGGGGLPPTLVGMAVAAVVGYGAVSMLLRVVLSMKLTPFVVYCAVLGLWLIGAPPA